MNQPICSPLAALEKYLEEKHSPLSPRLKGKLESIWIWIEKREAMRTANQGAEHEHTT
jgi:hypothetical protein